MGAKKISELKRTYSSSNDDLILLQKSYGTRIITKADFLAGYSPGTGNSGNSVSKKFTIGKDDWSFNNVLNKYTYTLIHEMDLKIEELIVNFYLVEDNTRILLDYKYLDSNTIIVESNINNLIFATISKTISDVLVDGGDGTCNNCEENTNEINRMKQQIVKTNQDININSNNINELDSKMNNVINDCEENAVNLKNDINIIEIGLDKKINQVNLQYSEIANDKIPKLESQLEDITSIPRGVNMAKAINSLIASGKKNIKIPAGTWTITEPIILENYVEIYSDKNTTLTTSLDIPIFTTKKIDGIGVSEVYIHDLGLTNAHSNPTNYQLDLCNVSMSKISRVKCITNSSDKNSVGGLKAYKKGVFVAPSGIFSILIDKCDFRNSSMEILITDSYITNCNIWAYDRSFALHIGASSQQISDCQFVGSDVKGAVWIEDTSLGYDIEIIKISNCYFDGSYGDIQSGIGLNAKKMRYSNISNCSFWHQKEDGIVLDNCFGNTITNNNFKCNGVNNQRENNTLNKAQGFSDIKIINSFYSNVISSNAFSTDGIDYFIKNKAINSIDVTDSYNNIIANNTIHDHWRYPTNAFDTSKIQGSKFNNLNGTESINTNSYLMGSIEFSGNIKTAGSFYGKGFKGERVFNFDDLNTSSGQGVSASGRFPIYAFTKETLVTGIALNISTPITNGSITIKICKNSVTDNDRTITISKGQYTTVVDFSTPLVFGRGDTLTVKAWSTDLEGTKAISATVAYTQ